MKIINQSHTIEHITPNILQQIEKSGRVCWKSEGKIGCLLDSCVEYSRKLYDCDGNFLGSECDNCKHHSSLKFAKMIIKKKHEAILEFGDIHVRLITNRGVLAELTRHRVGMSYAVESTRYVRYDGQMEFIRPVWWEGSTTQQQMLWRDAMNYAASYYAGLLHIGWGAEQAREVLPNSLKTEIVVKGNIRSFRHLFKLRTSKKAHPMIRSLFTNLLNDLKEQIPVVFDDIGGENGNS